MMILQANMHRSTTAHALLQQYVIENSVVAVIISEQNKSMTTGTWIDDETKTAAIWLPPSANFPIIHSGYGRCFAWIKNSNLSIISCYLTPRLTDGEFQVRLNDIEDKARQIGNPLIIAGDFNAKATEWGSTLTNRRGRMILDMAARLGLYVANSGTATTFRRPGCTPTTPDITLVSDSLAGKLKNWRVLEEYNGSDHQYISFEIGERAQRSLRPQRQGTRKWNSKSLDVPALIATLDICATSIGPSSEASTIVEQTMSNLVEACNVSMPKIGKSTRRKAAYWWTSEIADLRRTCLRCRRRLTRARPHGGASIEEDEYKAARKNLKKAITESKRAKWEELRNDLNQNPWGIGYRIVSNKLGASTAKPELSSQKMTEIVDTLFPTHAPLPIAPAYLLNGNPQLFTNEELTSAARTLKTGKAPGPDGVPAEVLQAVAAERPSMLLRMYNACLTEGVFPHMWKKQQLTLISKNKGDPERAEAYRPLCMLNTAGKLLERLIKLRLTAAINDTGGLSSQQHGFRPGRSTLGAIQDVVSSVEAARSGNSSTQKIVLLALLDVRNAFNSMRWADLIEALENKYRIPEYLLRMIRSYLKDRVLVYHTTEGEKQKKLTSGAAQGSILGPDLWNINYDEILNLEMPEETHLVAYADDIAAVIAARNVEHAQRKLNIIMMRTKAWLDSRGLKLATEKTELILLTRRHIQLEIEMRVLNSQIKTKREVKYLGIRLDPRMTYTAQIQHASLKAGKVMANLSRLMANVGGPTQCKRKLLMECANNILLYGCEIWGDAIRAQCRRKTYAAVQRTAALRIASAYRTVSGSAVLVISGTIPIDLLISERKARWEARQVGEEPPDLQLVRAETMQKWQQRWSTGTDGRWTRKLIPELTPWITRNFGEVDYYLTQLLSGHGYFRKYLHRRNLANDQSCIYGDNAIDDVEHTFFQCERWGNERIVLQSSIGSATPRNIIGKMLNNEANWKAVVAFTNRILRRKKIDLDAVQNGEEEVNTE